MTKGMQMSMNTEMMKSVHDAPAAVAAAQWTSTAGGIGVSCCCSRGIEFIQPCKERMQQILRCCQDVATQLDVLQTRLQLPERATLDQMPISDSSEVQILLLRDEIVQNKTQINQLLQTEISLRKKLLEMEEKVQALSAQILIYKEDFDLERRDREKAQSTIAELEQTLRIVCDERPNIYQDIHRMRMLTAIPNTDTRINRSDRFSCTHHNGIEHELVPRGYDVCDFVQPDGTAEDDEETDVAEVSEPDMKDASGACRLEEDGDDWRRSKDDVHPMWMEERGGCDRNSDCVSLSEDLKAQSFNMSDFLMTDEVSGFARDSATAGIPLALPFNATKEKSFDAGKQSVEPFQILLTPDDRFPLRMISSETNKSRKERPINSSGNGHLRDRSNDNFQFQTDGIETTRQRFNRSNNLEIEENFNTLRCPKCDKSFSQRDHWLLINHLEEC